MHKSTNNVMITHVLFGTTACRFASKHSCNTQMLVHKHAVEEQEVCG